MDEMSINIQQLPISILETIVSDLNIDEQVVLANINMYFYSIVTPILYKYILFHFTFEDDDFKSEATEEYNQLLELAMSELVIDDEFYYETIKAEIERDLYKNKVVKKLDEYRQKLWSKLEPAIKKHHKSIFGSQCFNPNNLIAEIESYSNLKQYILTVDTQQGMDQLKSCISDKFKFMKMLKLHVESDLKYEIEDFYHHLIHLEALDINMNLFHNDLKRFSRFSSNTLNYLSVDSLEEVSTDLLYIIHRNFKNLVYLNISLTGISWAPNLKEQPIFENLLHFTFRIHTDVDSRALSYMSNAKFWPKVIELYGDYFCFNGIVQFEGQWNNLTSLKAYYIDPTNLNQWNNFKQLQHLHLTIHSTSDSKMVETIFTNLTKLITLTLFGDISSQHFDFIPHIQLCGLTISNLINFFQPFVNFLKALLTIHTLRLYFTDNAFDNIDLNNLLKEKHKFPNLGFVRLDDLPEQLQQWFLHSLSLPSTYYFDDS